MIESGPTCSDNIELTGGRFERAAYSDVKVAKENKSASQLRERCPKCRGIYQTITQLHQSRACIDRRMVNQHNRCPLLHRRVCQYGFESLKLYMTKVTGGYEGWPRHAARQGDDRQAYAQLDARKAARWEIPGELRQITLEKAAEMVRKAAFAIRRRQVDIMVSRHNGHFRLQGRCIKQRPRLFVLMFQREVCNIAGNDEMIRRCSGGGKYFEQILAPMHTSAMQDEIRVTGHPFIEDDAAPLGAGPREDMKIR